MVVYPLVCWTPFFVKCEANTNYKLPVAITTQNKGNVIVKLCVFIKLMTNNMTNSKERRVGGGLKLTVLYFTL